MDDVGPMHAFSRNHRVSDSRDLRFYSSDTRGVAEKFVHRSNIVQEDFKGIRNPALLSYSP